MVELDLAGHVEEVVGGRHSAIYAVQEQSSDIAKMSFKTNVNYGDTYEVADGESSQLWTMLVGALKKEERDKSGASRSILK